MVATPIGNLDDITLRALKVLKQVQLVAAEDTRRTGILLRHFGIETPILSVHEHNERARIERIVVAAGERRVGRAGHRCGHPGNLGPGRRTGRRRSEAGFRVEPIPGASAVAAAISASGVAVAGLHFPGISAN